MGEIRGVLLVARDGDALEEQAVAPGHAEGGVVRRREVLRGVKTGCALSSALACSSGRLSHSSCISCRF